MEPKDTFPPYKTTMFDLRINVKHANPGTSIQRIHNHIKEIVQELQKADPTIQVLPWTQSTNHDHFYVNHIPQAQAEVNKYFPRIKIVVVSRHLMLLGWLGVLQWTTGQGSGRRPAGWF